ncbi:7-deoxyloganetin glucosyltransferase-like isoform X2 [Argentina anserina]|uniref:7-deoxyloganetin glucosyltransferase-like isoform X2 n=1 Tax=Argentina anserina TaxID=57926 RepID=UPI0021768A73|nr:7-deoxyloganetin glucosyltransferase-like isoform X2 [Potentilla anserina]
MMSSLGVSNKPHAVCIPMPLQSHIKAMLQLAQLLHHRDGLPNSVAGDTQNTPLLCDSVRRNCLDPFRNLLNKLDGNMIPVTCIISDGFLAFTITAAEELGIPVAQFFTLSAIGFMGCKQFPTLVEKGLAPLKDESCLTNGFLDKVIDWIPGIKDLHFRDLPGSWRTTNPDNIMFNFTLDAVKSVLKASAVLVHTFDALEPVVLDSLSKSTSASLLPPVYAVGPLQLLLNQIPEHPLKSVGYSIWKEETECLHWLNTKAINSVVYVNFGSLVVIKPEHLIEFGWGLAKSKLPFLWIIRSDLILGESATLPPEFVAEIEGRSLIASWCPQEQVLNHPSVGAFLTHSGWNSTIESISAGVPMLCWPLIGDQPINCRYVCNKWGIGMEIGSDVKRDEVEKLVKELMGGEKGKKMKTNVMEWKTLAEKASSPLGSSTITLDKLVNEVLLNKANVGQK